MQSANGFPQAPDAPPGAAPEGAPQLTPVGAPIDPTAYLGAQAPAAAPGTMSAPMGAPAPAILQPTAPGAVSQGTLAQPVHLAFPNATGSAATTAPTMQAAAPAVMTPYSPTAPMPSGAPEQGMPMGAQGATMPQGAPAAPAAFQQPMAQPLAQPVVQPLAQPNMQPLAQPLAQPTAQPFAQPFAQPVAQPIAQQPATQPSTQPVAQPIAQQPSAQPSNPPVAQPMQQQTAPTGPPKIQVATLATTPGSPTGALQLPVLPDAPSLSSQNSPAPAMGGPVTLPPLAPGAKRDLASLGLKGTTTMQLQGKKLRIGEVLIDMGMIDPGQLDHALRIQKETGQRLGKVLISEGLVSSTDIAKALARRLAVEYVDLAEMAMPEEVLKLIPYETCTRYDVVPIGEQGGSLLIAMADPTNVFALDDLRLVTGRDVRIVVASPEQIDIVISRMLNLDDAVTGAMNDADDWDDEHVPLEDIKNSEADAPAVSLVNQIITQAVVNGVSDLHFEPQADDMVVRFRKDGVLQHVTTVPGKLKNGVTSRLKIMASLDISERRKPQDGRVGLRVGEKPIDLRVAVLPTVYGEKSVLRVLDKSNVMLDMTDLGFLPAQLEKLRYCYTQPYGALLVTGPTGSGKSTTLYGAVNEINDVEKNIITVEDPVEYRLKGINQVQVNNKAGLSFAAALKSILRCDPDIVMIGEMRDHETAAIGIEAALTGHLVLSTLHTNTAPGAITRLTEMGIEPYLVSSSVLGVLAQRLARRLCKCAETYRPEREYLVNMKFPDWALQQFDQAPFELRKPVGCERCQGKGYKGRMGLHEVMLMSEEIARLAVAHASAEEIEKVAIDQGMITLWNDGVAKIIMGQSTMEELQRVVSH